MQNSTVQFCFGGFSSISMFVYPAGGSAVRAVKAAYSGVRSGQISSLKQHVLTNIGGIFFYRIT
ncbi:hypothetical protein ACMV5L_24680 [Serratia plymuthica]|uniref:hypothetical protein n=1 Tax=Serratia plymuthica TaxID=82996 RepID=UPI003DA279A2